jgi:ethanolamine ammonia-lyase small subunit
MSEKLPQNLTEDPWQQLRRFTRARIALGRTGSSLPTREILDFGMSHAMARDAVHLPLVTIQLAAALQAQGFDTLHVQSRAPDRATYLLRPDLGRRLEEESAGRLQAEKPAQPLEMVFIIGDGLSSMAVERHAVPLLAAIRERKPDGWERFPVVIASQCRVALGDEIGELAGARLVVMLIGERPGLSSPDSLGIYLTYDPNLQRHDAERNCISNVRPEGLSYTAAAHKLLWLAGEASRLGLSGVGLKDESDVQELAADSVPGLGSA